jgi:Haem-binding domain/Cytochrome P460
MPSNPRSRLRILSWLVAGACLIFLGLQLARPVITNPPVTADLQAPPEVKAILRNSCYNCHSNETKLPWFDQIVPAYWLVAQDVKQARKHLNFSEIAKLPAARQKGILFEAINQIQLGAMPLPQYLAVHPGAAVTQAQLTVLRNYLNPFSPATAATPADIAAADTQFAHSIQTTAPATGVKNSPNGVAFVPEYKTWRAISSTDRFDNNTMRVILGNDIAIKAIEENHINPWPNGTTFAKVTWHTQPDGTGLVKTGAFQQVELMIRDSDKYASTKGWGWGRWLGTELKPYGSSADVSNECVSCHTPVRNNDYVYTMPLEREQGGQK